MKYDDIIGEFINDFQLIIDSQVPELDSNRVYKIKIDVQEALAKILEKYKLINQLNMVQ